MKNWDKKLLEAVKLGNLNDVEKCVKNGADIEHFDRDGDTILSNAAYYGHIKIVQYVVCLGADLNKTGPPKFRTPLSWALYKGHIDSVKYLAHRGGQLTVSYHNPLVSAVVCGKVDVVKSLLESETEPNTSKESGITALSYAAILGYLDVLKLLVKAGADVNHVDERKKAPITHAIEADNFHIVEYLIAQGCQIPWLEELVESRTLNTLLASLNIIYELVNRDPNPGTLNSPTRTCLSNAIKNENLSILKYLVGKGVSVTPHASLSDATLTGNLEITEFLLHRGCSVNKIDSAGNTPLTNAVRSKNINMVRVLINANSDVCKVGQNGRTPLSVAVELQNFELVELLLNKGASPTMQTAFIEAIQAGNLQIIQHLKEKGALINFMYEDGYTPLTKAIQAGNLEIAQFLYEQGADTDDVITDEKNLYLMNYIKDNNFDMVKFLVELGVKLDLVGENGYTPLTKAVELENFEMVKYFIKEGVNINFTDGNRKVALAIAATNSCFSIVKFLIESEADIELAKSELATYSSWNKDIDIYLKLWNKGISKTVTGSGHEGSDSVKAEGDDK